VTSLVSSIALIALFGAGLAATASRHLPAGYLAAAGLALALVAGVLVVIFLVGAHPEIAERRGGPRATWRGTCARASTRRRSAGPAAGWRR